MEEVTMSKIINKSEFDQQIKEGVTVVDMYATWCGPCKIMAPAFDAAGEAMKAKASFVKVDIDNDGEVAMRYGVQSVPTMLIFKDGELKDTIVGVVDQKTLEAKVEAIV